MSEQELHSLFREVQAIEGRMAALKTEFDYDLARVAKAFEQAQEEYESVAARLERKARYLRAERREEEAGLEERRELIETLRRDKIDAFEFIGRAYADYEEARSLRTAVDLENKDHPAPGAAEAVRSKGRELAEARRRLKVAEWTRALYESSFPWLTELRNIEEEEAFIAGADGTADEANDDPTRKWLTKEEYSALPPAERNQQALDRYLRSRKTPWQIGRDYERYVGYLREQDGWTVTYQGIFKGLEDLGRDIVAERHGVVEVIQCKRWAQSKTIHEKHVFQLFGTVVALRIERPEADVRGTFVTTTGLSETAHKFARQLEIAVQERFPLDDYPRIKCNVSRPTGERIYHLPFDQQYDTTVVESDRGELYAETVAQAEDLGFRRAWRWREQSNDG